MWDFWEFEIKVCISAMQLFLGISKNVIQQQSLCYFLIDIFWNFHRMESTQSHNYFR